MMFFDILDGMIKTGCATNRPEAIRQVILLYKSCLTIAAKSTITSINV